ncbi:MAG TPA: hypothetical protein PLU37_14365 [Chitinophagaceae bacterium]|nr:hypothetical protein [Chitinophagaceae bacterium]
MKATFMLLLTALLFSISSYEQEMKFEGTHPPNPEVLKLLEREGAIMDSKTNVKERDSLRSRLISKGWFYHGIDGLPISLDGLTKRQTKNQFKQLEAKVISETLYQYETTAILVSIFWQKVLDKGELKENTRSNLIVMGLENGEWKMQADIIGMNPKIKQD